MDIKNILIAGGSGFVGTSLTSYLENIGYSVFILSTNKSKCDTKSNYFYWSPIEKIIDKIDLTFDTIINMAGANIGDKFWTSSRKKELLNSRVISTQFLSYLSLTNRLKADYFIQFSAIGYYGDRNDELLNESSTKGTGFLSDLCDKWENAHKMNIPRSILRVGVVFDKNGGALPKLTMSTRFGIGVIMGNGKNYLSWISLMDLNKIIVKLINERSEGIHLGCNGTPIRQKDLIGRYLGTKALKLRIFIPNFLLERVLGDMVEIFTFSQKVKPEKWKQFEFHKLEKL